MTTIFDYDKKAFKEFSKFYRAAPAKARRATARMLTRFAFGTREEAIKEIHRTMTVRSEGFVKRQMRFKGARATNIDNQESSTFSVATDRFTGWKEQNDGTPDKRTRSQSLLARGRSFDKKVSPRNRMKPGNRFFSANSFDKMPTGAKETPALIKRMKVNHKNKPFIIKKRYKRIKRGVYKFVRNKMMILQNFEKKRTTPKKNPWMRSARENYFRSANLDREWTKSIEFITRKKKF